MALLERCRGPGEGGMQMHSTAQHMALPRLPFSTNAIRSSLIQRDVARFPVEGTHSCISWIPLRSLFKILTSLVHYSFIRNLGVLHIPTCPVVGRWLGACVHFPATHLLPSKG